MNSSYYYVLDHTVKKMWWGKIWHDEVGGGVLGGGVGGLWKARGDWNGANARQWPSRVATLRLVMKKINELTGVSSLPLRPILSC